MPVIPDPDRPERRTLTDADGVPLARYTHVERDGRRIADLLELEAPLERALPVLTRELAGMRIAGPEALGRALAAAGARPARHAHVYRHALRERPREPTGLAPLDHTAAELLPAYLAAHPPGHVDSATIAGEDSEAFLTALLRGDWGPLLDCSGVALAGGRVVGAIVCAEVEPPMGGPWVMELFRAPEAPGTGRALLERALARSPGPSLGLAVTVGNPAVRLYEALGFERVLTTFSVDL